MNRLQALWWRIRKPVTALSDRDRLRNILVKEVEYSAALAGFLCHGLNHGRAAKITIEIDGTSCDIGILVMKGDPLMEYLTQWACAKKIEKYVRLGEFDQQGKGGGGVALTVGPSAGVWFTEKQVLVLPDDVYNLLYPPAEKTGDSGPEI
jgi:hypothetical protein